MKKQILLCGIAALAFCSCSNDEVIETAKTNEPATIMFSPTVGGMTRGVTTTSSLEQFTVNAYLTQGETNYHYIKDLNVYKQNGAWIPAQSYTWPYSGTMTFYSYSPSSLNVTMPSADMCTTVAPTIEYKASSNNERQLDVLYAVNEANAATVYGAEGNKTVNVNFRHALSQVVFSAKCTNPNWILDISDVMISNVKASGVYTFPTQTTAPLADGENVRGSWALTDDLFYYSAKFADKENIGAEAVALTTSAEGALLVMPQTRSAWEPKLDPFCSNKGAYFMIRCKIQQITPEGNVLLWPSTSTDAAGFVAIPVNINWEEGKKYTYTFVFGESAGFIPPTNTEGGEDVVPGANTLSNISFSVSVDEFQSENNTNVEF